MSDGLKPCPFCGGEAIYGKSEASGRVRTVCVDCLASTDWLAGTDEAAAAWNRRAERTCRMGSPIDGEYQCGECGHLNKETYRADKGWYPPDYCAHCGAGVVES